MPQTMTQKRTSALTLIKRAIEHHERLVDKAQNKRSDGTIEKRSAAKIVNLQRMYVQTNSALKRQSHV